MTAQQLPVVEVTCLVKDYGSRRAIDAASFRAGAGEFIALLGPNGAGKTSLIGCLLGFLLPSSGEVALFGQNASDLPPLLRGRTGFVPQKMTGFTNFRVGELIAYLARFYVPIPDDVPRWLLDWADLDMQARVKSLSGGQRQRLSILLGMRHQPDLLVLDEPVASLDPQARRDFMHLLADYCTNAGRTVIISSHILSDLERMVTRAIFMRRGQVVHDTPMARFREQTRWIKADASAAQIRAALPAGLAVLGERPTGGLLVDGWTPDSAAALSARLSLPVETELPDLETAFLEMTR